VSSDEVSLISVFICFVWVGLERVQIIDGKRS
jgi:hypothetical protein